MRICAAATALHAPRVVDDVITGTTTEHADDGGEDSDWVTFAAPGGLGSNRRFDAMDAERAEKAEAEVAAAWDRQRIGL